MNLFKNITKRLTRSKKRSEKKEGNLAQKSESKEIRKQEKRGRKNIASIKYSLIPISTGSDLTQRKLPMMEVKSKNEGPVLWLTSCVHGDEVGGMVIVQEVFNFVKKVGLKKGKLMAIPLVNPMGFEYLSRTIPTAENVPSFEDDINRVFPGNKNGAISERVAYKVFDIIEKTKPNLVLDIHNDWLDTVPYAVLDSEKIMSKEVFEKMSHFAKKTGFVSVIDKADDLSLEKWKKSLSGSLNAFGIPALTLELGPDKKVHENFVEYGVSAIVNILYDMGMIDLENFEEYRFDLPENISGKILQYSAEAEASKSGVVRYIAKAGTLVKKGEMLAKIYNPFGKLEETVIAVEDAYVLGHNDISIANPGTALYALASIES